MATWPATLPAFNLPLSDRQQDDTLRSPMDAGPEKVRRRFTASSRFYGVRIRMTGTEYDVLTDFYNTNLEFQMADPKTGIERAFRFSAPPEGRQITGDSDAGKRVWDVSLQLERLP